MRYFTTFILTGQLISDGASLISHHGGGNRDSDEDNEAKGKNDEGFHRDICVNTSKKQRQFTKNCKKLTTWAWKLNKVKK